MILKFLDDLTTEFYISHITKKIANKTTVYRLSVYFTQNIVTISIYFTQQTVLALSNYIRKHTQFYLWNDVRG